MAFKLAEAYVEFKQKGLSAVTTAISGLATGVGAAVGIASEFADRLGQLGQGAIGLVKLAADAETTETQFRVLLGSGEAAKKMIAQIDQFAAKTPFQKLGISDASRQLLNAGIAADDVFSHLKGIGDIAALTGGSIDDLAGVYGRFVSEGRVQADGLNQLTDRGIPIIRELADHFGVAESKIREMASNGEISASDITQAFTRMTGSGGQFENGMSQLSETTAGKFSTMLDSVSQLKSTFGELLLPLAGQGLDIVTSFVQELTSAFRTDMPNALEVGESAFRDIINTVRDVGTVVGVVAANIPLVWDAALDEIPKTAKSVFNWLVENAKIAAENLGFTIRNAIQDAFGLQADVDVYITESVRAMAMGVLGEKAAAFLGVQEIADGFWDGFNEGVNNLLPGKKMEQLKQFTELELEPPGRNMLDLGKAIEESLEKSRANRSQDNHEEKAVELSEQRREAIERETESLEAYKATLSGAEQLFNRTATSILDSFVKKQQEQKEGAEENLLAKFAEPALAGGIPGGIPVTPGGFAFSAGHQFLTDQATKRFRADPPQPPPNGADKGRLPAGVEKPTEQMNRNIGEQKDLQVRMVSILEEIRTAVQNFPASLPATLG